MIDSKEYKKSGETEIPLAFKRVKCQGINLTEGSCSYTLKTIKYCRKIILKDLNK